MIKQVAIGLNSRSEANPFDENGFLPLITAPIYSTVDKNNYELFLDNKIQVCLPRKTELSGDSILKYGSKAPIWFSLSLQEFIDYWASPNITKTFTKDSLPYKICIDTANGNMPSLHEAIRKAKEIHGDKLIIMAGNVASVEAFVELARTGVDYIRCGIGGSSSCNTTSNTGVGQKNLAKLIRECYSQREYCKEEDISWSKSYPNAKQIYLKIKNGESVNFIPACKSEVASGDYEKIGRVKIVADGISSYIKLCQEKYGFNDNGYAAINKLLFAGSDLVMVGKLFAQCLESAGEKRINENTGEKEVKYAGMSTREMQKIYK